MSRMQATRQSSASRSDAGRSRRGGSWVLLPFVWCLWLLVWLAPSLLIEPHLDVKLPWLAAETAPAALAAGMAFFLVSIWPFWPALASAGEARGQRISFRWVGTGLLELVMLFVLAVPFTLVAWSVSGREVAARSLAAAAGGLLLLALGIRTTNTGMGPAAGRWLMVLAILICAGPVMVAYAANETMGVALPRLLEVSPMVGTVRLVVEGWPQGAWRTFAYLEFWPAVGVILVLVGLSESARRRRRGEAAAI